MTSYGRPLLKAAMAGGLLCGFWFVPSANASSEEAAGASPARSETRGETRPPGEPRLASTGSFDSTPCLVGAISFLSVGGLMIAESVRRSRTARCPTGTALLGHPVQTGHRI